MFSKPKPVDMFSRRLVGEWRAETSSSSGQVSGVITAIFESTGVYLIRRELGGSEGANTVSQSGRFRVEPVDKTRFKLTLADEDGAPAYSSVRSFPDADTMLVEAGRTIFQRVR
jgi:hypothetical protein